MSATASFRISASIPVPDDVFSQAETMTKLKPALEAFQKALPKGSEYSAKIVRGRDETTPRKRKATVDAEPSVAQVAPIDSMIEEAAE